MKTKSEREEEEKMRASLEEAYIFDPVTNSKITLEQAESGEWEVNEDEFWEMPEEDIRKFAFEEQKIEERALNLLRSSKQFLKTEPLSDDEIDVLESGKILSQYGDWSYNNIFKFNEGFILTPYVKYEYRVLMWLKIFDINGHYYFREKTKVEAFFDKIRMDDDIEINNYECYTFKKSYNVSKVGILIRKIAQFSGLEIEIKDENLFIISQKLVNKEDIIKFEKYCQYYIET
ncbi:hypothetical protein [Winogradskyella sp.]|uniref:hypothetical protein n=1 Tax=Winogradskyella sp. TaxID=1883156 RepID=UPI003BAD827A